MPVPAHGDWRRPRIQICLRRATTRRQAGGVRRRIGREPTNTEPIRIFVCDDTSGDLATLLWEVRVLGPRRQAAAVLILVGISCMLGG